MGVLDRCKHYFTNGNKPALTVFNIVGSPGTGKTEFVNYMVHRLYDILGSDNIYYIKTRKIMDVFREINPNKEYNLIFVDDAGKEQDSRRSMSTQNIEIYENLPDVRHHAKQLGYSKGRIIIFLANHVPKHIDHIVRSFSKATFYKDLNLQEDQYKQVLKNCGIKRYDVENWIDRVSMEYPDALSRVLMVLKSGRWAWVNFEPKEEIIPDKNIINYSLPDSDQSQKVPEVKKEDPTEDIEELKDLLDRELSKMKENNKWYKKALALEKSLKTSKSYIEIAEEIDSKEGNIGYFIREALGELKRRIGLEYEKLVAKKLEDQGYNDVKRMGGTGEPDILAVDPDGTQLAINVKLYSYGRSRQSIPKKELQPELNFKENNPGSKAYIYYTNLAWGGSSGETYFFEIPEALDRIVIKKNKGLVT